VDEAGRRRPEWAAALTRRPLRTKRRSPEAGRRVELVEVVRRLGHLLDPKRRLVALAGLVIGG